MMYQGSTLYILGLVLVLGIYSNEGAKTKQTDYNHVGEYNNGNSEYTLGGLINIDDESQNDGVMDGSGGRGDDLDNSSGMGPDDEDGDVGSGNIAIVTGVMTKCTLMKKQAETMGLIGSFKPACTENGAFNTVQCHASTGHCWCVDQYGTEIAYTRKKMPEMPHCADENMPVLVQEYPVRDKNNKKDRKEEGYQRVNDPIPTETSDSEDDEPKSGSSKSSSEKSENNMLPGIIGGAVVGLLCAILLVMFIVYRMRKKDEGSYALDEPKNSPTPHTYQKAPTREFYA